MLGNLARITTFARAPKKTYVMRHPIRSVRMMKRRQAIRHAVTDPRAFALMEAVAAVPVGIWLGRKLLG